MTSFEALLSACSDLEQPGQKALQAALRCLPKQVQMFFYEKKLPKMQ